MPPDTSFSPRIDRHSLRQFSPLVPAVTVKLPKTVHSRLAAEAARRGTSEASILRESFEKMSGLKKMTLWDRIGHLAGTIDGPGNLSTLSKTLPGYGRSRSR